MSVGISRRLCQFAAVSGLSAWLTAPLVARAASFDEIFRNLPEGNTVSDKQSAITELFNTRVYVWGLYIVSVAAIFGIFYGGYLYITANGNAEQAEKGKRSLLYAILGIVVLGILFAVMSASRNIGAGVASGTVDTSF